MANVSLSVQNRQTKVLRRMLCGNPEAADDDQVCQMIMVHKIIKRLFKMIGEWKVLVYDRAGRDILLPLFTVAQLKNLGITVSLAEISSFCIKSFELG